MIITTIRFGAIDVDDAAIITFTQPVIGFQAQRRFVVLPGPPGSFVKWLQSADSGELAFLMMDPKTVVPDYKVTLGPDDLAELDVPAVEALDIYTLVVVPADRTQIRTNLKAPIVINPKQRLGKQMVLERSEYPVQFFLAQALRAPQKPQEVVNARTDA